MTHSPATIIQFPFGIPSFNPVPNSEPKSNAKLNLNSDCNFKPNPTFVTKPLLPWLPEHGSVHRCRI